MDFVTCSAMVSFLNLLNKVLSMRVCALSRVLGIGWVASHRQVEIDMDYVWMPMLVSRNIMYNVNQQQAKVFALKWCQPLMGQLLLMQLKGGLTLYVGP